MSASAPHPGAPLQLPTRGAPAHSGPPALIRIRDYFASDSRRAFQTVLGLFWLIDGALQFQPDFYTGDFVHFIQGNSSGQPHWIASTVNWAAGVIGPHLAVFNTLFALTQVAIGLGLLCRRTVKPALLLSFAWVLVVWWFGEGFGFLLTSKAATSNPQVFTQTANPLTGAPGAVSLYGLVGLLVWPGKRPGGLLGVRGARIAWAVLWLVMAALWLAPVNRGPDSVYNAIMMAPAGMYQPAGVGWLARIEGAASLGAQGHGLAIAVALAAVSAAIGLAVAFNWRALPFLIIAILLSLGYWVVGQGFGGIIYTNSATDLNSGPLFVLLAFVLYSLTPYRWSASTAPAGAPGGSLARDGGGSGRVRPRPSPAVLAATLVAIAAVGVVVTSIAQTPPPAPRQAVVSNSPFDGQPITPPVNEPPVTLTNYSGRPVSLSQYAAQDKAVLLMLVTTRCAPRCQVPKLLAQTLAKMPESERAHLQMVAITLNPRLDTRARVAAYLHRYHLTGSVQYLIGSSAQLQPVWTEWNAGAAQAGTAIMYGIDAGGAVMTSYSAFFTPQQLIHDVKRLESL